MGDMSKIGELGKEKKVIGKKIKLRERKERIKEDLTWEERRVR